MNGKHRLKRFARKGLAFMRIWTIQPYEVYQQILKTGHFYCDPNLSIDLKDDVEFRRSYQWMIEQMKCQIGGPEREGSYPIWAWYRSHDYKNQRPDFRQARDYSDEVCIELEISEKKVLLSDFEAWHFVLNDWYYSPATSEEEWNQRDEWFERLSEKEQRRVKLKSWNRIFDITPRKGEWTKNGDIVQACFWSLNRNQVRKVWRLRKGQKTHEIYSI